MLCMNHMKLEGSMMGGRGTGGVYLDRKSESDTACLVSKQVCVCKVKTRIRLE